MSNKTAAADAAFRTQLIAYKKLIDADIEQYSRKLATDTLQQYGAYARIATDAYLEILGRGGKRVRGALVMLGYQMCGGKDEKMIVRAARAVEMMHAYILMLDDIQDRSHARRGGPAAHIALSEYHHKNQLAGDSDHFGIAIAINAALAGAHRANALLATMPGADDVHKLRALDILNSTMVITSHGQTYDLVNGVVDEVSEEQVERVLEWKTAHYTILNPLHIGMVLAGADVQTLEAISGYAMHAGKAFQITDDILGTFGSEFESGKSPLDDMREGKRTALTVYALQHTTNGNKNFLIQMLGNQQLTPAEFNRCKDILVESGALEHARNLAVEHIDAAIVSLEENAGHWSAGGTQFLRGLAQYMVDRQA